MSDVRTGNSGLTESLETILFGAVHDVSVETKLEAARKIKAAANRCPMVIDDWNEERLRAEEYREWFLAAKDYIENLSPVRSSAQADAKAGLLTWAGQLEQENVDA